MTYTYEAMACRQCGTLLAPKVAEVEKTTAATSFDACVYQCPVCEVGYSNNQTPAMRRRFSRRPTGNVPSQVASGLDAALARAFRGGRRKADWFCDETSEDAVTWTVFRWLYDVGALGAVAKAAKIQPLPAGDPNLLLWGAELDSNAAPIRDALLGVCDAVGEEPRGRSEIDVTRSEIDVTLVWPSAVVVVEAKHQSSNPSQANYPHYYRYLDRAESIFAVPIEEVANSPFYQLTRNWRLGSALAASLSQRAFYLINLGPADAIADDADFAALLAQDATRRFTAVTWEQLLTSAGEVAVAPDWLQRWLADRSVIGGS